MIIRTLLVDDEPHAREGIRLRLEEYSSIRIIGECASGKEALEIIRSQNPDLVFLDIQMPEMTGLEVVAQLSQEHLPLIVFETAYDTYAVKAFEFHALDYLLKPISDQRFRETMNVVLDEIRHRNIEKYISQLQNLVRDYHQEEGILPEEVSIPSPKNYMTRLMVKVKDTMTLLPIQEVEWIESAGDYIYIHSGAQKYIFRETLSSLEQRLDPQHFVRIHRSAIVNVNQIKQLRQNEHGDYDVYLNDGTKLKLSRTYKSHLQKTIGNTI